MNADVCSTSFSNHIRESKNKISESTAQLKEQHLMPAQLRVPRFVRPFPANTSPGAQFGHKVKHVRKTEA
jgi:hypothetical protein